jgi:hypothetical protein
LTMDYAKGLNVIVSLFGDGTSLVPLPS